ncbi:MAG: phosphodiesterase [Alphaproteobacteria bacterium]|nr:phosphodiesterase [Alphaproteobacteria bacterium]
MMPQTPKAFQSGATMKLIHVTDPHLVQPGGSLYGLYPDARFAAFVDDVNRSHGDAELCLITGDLTDLGEAEAYDLFAGELDRLVMPWRVILGNHDSRKNFRARFPACPVDDDGFVQDVVETSVGTLVLLDTNEPGIAAGRLCERRCAWLGRQLAAMEGQVMIAMHHPPFDVGIPRLDQIGLQDQAAFAETVLPHRDRIRHIFFGHVHRPVSGSWQGIGFSTLRATAHQVALHFDVRESLPGSHEPPAYAIVLVRDDAVIVHSHDFLDASPRFDMAKYDTKPWPK